MNLFRLKIDGSTIIKYPDTFQIDCHTVDCFSGPFAALDAGQKESGRPDLEAGRNFWSFSPLEQPKVPQVEDTKWCRTDVDRFVRKRQEAKGLVPSSTADARTLLRRAYFDLTGLPPSPEQTDSFLKAADGNLDAAYSSLLMNFWHSLW